MRHFDFLVIGSGPAGQRAAIQAAKLGKKAAIVERRPSLGGVLVHTGTMPSKTLREAALYLTGWDQRGLYGAGYRLKPDLSISDLMQRLQITLTHEVDVIQHQLARNQVSVIHGAASFLDPNHLLIEGPDRENETIHADKILIAVGTRPRRPDNVPFDDETIVDSDSILNLKRIPRSLTVVGGGVIGVEYASILSTLDIKVTLIDGRDELLPFLDRDVIDEFQHQIRRNNVALRLGESVETVEKDASGDVVLHLGSGRKLRSEVVMYAAGRVGNSESLKLENAGLTADKRQRLEVDENLATAVPHIYAAGDIIGFPALASTSMEQGRRAACHAFGVPTTHEPPSFPFGVYSVPEMSMVGLTEQDVIEKKIPYEVGIARLNETARGQIMGLRSGLLKLLVSLEDRRILGVHAVGEDVTELVHMGQAVIILGGTLDYFLENVFNYPTLAEAYKIAALDAWNRLS